MRVGLLRFSATHRERARAAALRPFVFSDLDPVRLRIRDAFFDRLRRVLGDADVFADATPAAKPAPQP